MRAPIAATVEGMLTVMATSALAQTAPQPTPPKALSFNPDAGVVYQSGDFRVTAWGYVERAIDPHGPDYFRRLRQGAEIDLPRISEHLRVAAVYEFDLTDTNAFGINPGPAGAFSSRDAENLFVALQDADDPGKFRALS